MHYPVAMRAVAAGKIPPADFNFVTDPTVHTDRGTGTSTGLLCRAVQRQTNAWDNLVSLYGPLVYRWCRRWGLQAKDAENVGQEVFLRVFQGLSAFRHDRPGDSFRGWLGRIARNCYLDHVQRQQKLVLGTGGSESQKRIEQFPDDHSNDEDQATTDREDITILYQQAVQLIRREYTQRDWQIFQRVVINGESPAAVAAEMQVSSNVVYLIKSRVLRRLRDEFAEVIDF